jgi:NAD(P)-dependent dehydrogenase (short-subunit alcohol dehydrogenase family)
MFDFAGRTILITGASSGIGRACAQRLAAANAHIVAIGRNAATLQDLAAGKAHTYAVDLADESAVKDMVARLKAEVGPLDGCVLSAGVHGLRPLMMESYKDLYRPWAVNVQGVLGVLALLVKNRLIAKGGSVVLFSSASARRGGAGMVSYAASKGAIEAATQALAAELVSQAIRVNAVAPGVVRTPMSEGFLKRLTPEQIATLEARHLMGFGTPEDVAGPVAFLLSQDARWITGIVLAVDGGYGIG